MRHFAPFDTRAADERVESHGASACHEAQLAVALSRLLHKGCADPMPAQRFIDYDRVHMRYAVVYAQATKRHYAAGVARGNERVLEAFERSHVGRLPHRDDGGVVVRLGQADFGDRPRSVWGRAMLHAR